MPTTSPPSSRSLTMVHSVMRHWLTIFLVGYGIFNALPFAAPVFMRLGWSGPANAIYTGYSLLCHQMAQRSFFLFGDRLMYAPDELPLALTGSTGTDTLLLRNFRGSETLGWKVAWSDRMVSLYGGVWLAGLVYWAVARVRTVKPLSIGVFALLLLPLAIDGSTHMLSDSLGGLTAGFRYHNDWLAALTGNRLPDAFYSGDALGSFNSMMRLLTGALAAAGVVWLAFPIIDRSARTTAMQIDRIVELRRSPYPQPRGANPSGRNSRLL